MSDEWEDSLQSSYKLFQENSPRPLLPTHLHIHTFSKYELRDFLGGTVAKTPLKTEGLGSITGQVTRPDMTSKSSHAATKTKDPTCCS